MKVSIPFNDLHLQYLSIKDEIDESINAVISKSAFVRGEYVESFENDFSKMFNSKYCISCANGTDALYIAIKALGIEPGDEVIVPAHTWISTSETVTQAGGRVVFCDTEPDTFNIDTEKIAEKITNKTVGIIPVHLYGQPVDMDNVMKIASKYNLWVLEDCAQAHLAKYKGQQVGTFGNAATFSFYPGKNLGAMGDAGAIITNDPELKDKMTIFARHGGLKKGHHVIEGINSRLDGLQAAILSVKLKYLRTWTDKRQELGILYSDKLSDINGLEIPKVRNYAEPVWHLYVIKTKLRNELQSFLKEKGIQTVINYPIALPFLEAYKYMQHENHDFPNAFNNQSMILSLPLFPEITDGQVEMLIDSIVDFSSK